MNINEFIKQIERILENKGSIDVVNNKGIKLDITKEIYELLSYIEQLEENNKNLIENNKDFKIKLSLLSRYKKLVEEFKVRREILEQHPNFKTLRRLQFNKQNWYGAADRDAEINLLELFDMIDELKL